MNRVASLVEVHLQTESTGLKNLSRSPDARITAILGSNLAVVKDNVPSDFFPGGYALMNHAIKFYTNKATKEHGFKSATGNAGETLSQGEINGVPFVLTHKYDPGGGSPTSIFFRQEDSSKMSKVIDAVKTFVRQSLLAAEDRGTFVVEKSGKFLNYYENSWTKDLNQCKKYQADEKTQAEAAASAKGGKVTSLRDALVASI